MGREEEMLKERLKKLDSLKKAKINPYPYNYDQKHSASELQKKYSKLKNDEKTKDKVSIAGRLMSLRSFGKIGFGKVQDHTGLIQIVFEEKFSGKKVVEFFSKYLDIGDIIGVEGIMHKTKRGEVSVLLKKIELLSKSLNPLPDKWHGLQDKEERYRKRHLDLIMDPEIKEVFVKRAKIYKAIREFLDKRGFIEVHTPILQTQYGGANARPFITNINAWNMPMYLRIAYELHLKRLIVGGFNKVYDLSSCFRNEGVDRTHNPEFSMMEIQWAYADYNDSMKLTEELWEYVAKKVLGTTIMTYEGKRIDLKTPWKRLTVKNALKKFASINVDKLSDVQLKALVKKHNIDCEPVRGIMITNLFEELCEDKLIQPTHIIDHPKESCPLSKPHRKDPELIERVEPFINGWEVGNCYSELTDPILQKKLLEEQAKKRKRGDEEAHPMDEDYVDALKYGLPPNTGTGIGVDRMIMLLTDSSSIRDVLLFPIMKPYDPKENEKTKQKPKK